MSGATSTSTGSRKRWEALARAAHAARESDAVRKNREQLLTFVLDGAAYALPVSKVREIVRVRPATPVPRVPEDVQGVISLRGEIVQVIDLRSRLGLSPFEPSRKSRIVVVHAGDGQVAGLLVDSVTEVIAVDEEAMQQAAGESEAVASLCVQDEQFVSLVDLDRVLVIDADH